MTQHPATAGQTVIYHGGLTEFHGPARFVGVCEADGDTCRDCEERFDLWEFHRSPGDPPVRYRLDIGGDQHLRCVRAESFTAVVADTAATL